MPGYSSECVSGAHAACTAGQDCRCQCHPWTAALVQKGPGKPDPRGGIRRKKLKDADKVLATELAPDAIIKCGCGAAGRADDNFCHQCGQRLRGKECEKCGIGGESGDLFCRACGWKYGDKIPEQKPAIDVEAVKADLRERLKKSQAAQVPSAPVTPPLETEIPEEDPVVRARRIAVEKGLLNVSR